MRLYRDKIHLLTLELLTERKLLGPFPKSEKPAMSFWVSPGTPLAHTCQGSLSAMLPRDLPWTTSAPTAATLTKRLWAQHFPGMVCSSGLLQLQPACQSHQMQTVYSGDAPTQVHSFKTER